MACLEPMIAALAQLGEPGTLVSILAGVAGAVSGALGTYLARRYRIQSDSSLKEQQQLFAEYRRLVGELQDQVTRLRAEVSDLQDHYLECRAENAALRAKITDLQTQMTHIPGRPADGKGENPGAADRGRPGASAAP